MPKPLPDFTSPEWKRMSARGKFMVIREFVLNHDGPIAQADVRRLMAESCRLSMEILERARPSYGWSMDQIDDARMLNEQIAMYDREPT